MITRDDLTKDQKEKLEEVEKILEKGLKKLEGENISPTILQLALEEYEYKKGSTGYTGKWDDILVSNSSGYVSEMEVISPFNERFMITIKNDQGVFNVNKIEMVY
ncbi:MAG: hypothetical protein ACOCRX_08010 [Candidatus Woesearchaeota archaeon]